MAAVEVRLQAVLREWSGDEGFGEKTTLVDSWLKLDDDEALDVGLDEARQMQSFPPDAFRSLRTLARDFPWFLKSGSFLQSLTPLMHSES